MKEKTRNSSIELLRIISMLMIILSHCCIHGLDSLSSKYFINNFFTTVFFLGNLGVIIFMLITGYYTIESKFKLKKIIKLELEVVFYSILFYFLCTLFFEKSKLFSFELIKSFFPIIFKKYWFISAYVSMYIFTPYINKLLHNISKNEYKKLIILCTFVAFFIPTFTTADIFFNELFQFFTFYIIGGYIRMYNIKINKKITKALIISILMILILSAIILFFSKSYPILYKYRTYFLNRNSIFVLIIAIGIFLLFLKIPFFTNKIINYISKTIFGIYLIHDNPNFRNIIFKKIFRINKFIDSSFLVLVLLITTIIIFILSSLIEITRKKFFDKINDKISPYIETKIINFISEKYKKGE